MQDGGSRQKGWPIFGQDSNAMRRAASSIARIPENFHKDLSTTAFSSGECATIRASLPPRTVRAGLIHEVLKHDF